MALLLQVIFENIAIFTNIIVIFEVVRFHLVAFFTAANHRDIQLTKALHSISEETIDTLVYAKLVDKLYLKVSSSTVATVYVFWIFAVILVDEVLDHVRDNASQLDYSTLYFMMLSKFLLLRTFRMIIYRIQYSFIGLFTLLQKLYSLNFLAL